MRLENSDAPGYNWNNPRISRIVNNSKEQIVNKTFLGIMEQQGCDVELDYKKWQAGTTNV